MKELLIVFLVWVNAVLLAASCGHVLTFVSRYAVDRQAQEYQDAIEREVGK